MLNAKSLLYHLSIIIGMVCNLHGISALSLYSFKHTHTHTRTPSLIAMLIIVGTRDIIVKVGEDQVAIPCLVSVSGSSSTAPVVSTTPVVSWFRLNKRTMTYENIRDITLFAYPHNVACVYQAESLYMYDCSLMWGPIQQDDDKSQYKCVVTEPDSGMKVEEETKVNGESFSLSLRGVARGFPRVSGNPLSS